MNAINWSSLPFGYFKTDFNVRYYYKQGSWSSREVSTSETFPMHIAATALHYGQESFEGMKAFMGKDGKVRIFRWRENAARMKRSAEGIMLAPVPEEIFREGVFTAVSKNKKYVPPYGSGASLYIRPLLIGTSPEVGVKPASEYMFLVFVTPVGPYFTEGFKPVDMMICREYDRAAPKGTGNIKVGGNYAASLRAITKAQKQGFANAIFLDAKEKKYIDECGPANFFGVRNNTYLTPDSPSILPSIINKSLIQIARDMGIKTERRPIPVEELESLEEAGACGTAAVISPIRKIIDAEKDKIYVISRDGNPGPVSVKLYQQLTSIQNGDVPDPYGWIEMVE
jgi:branched-chain amino acid aminotransferase